MAIVASSAGKWAPLGRLCLPQPAPVRPLPSPSLPTLARPGVGWPNGAVLMALKDVIVGGGIRFGPRCGVVLGLFRLELLGRGQKRIKIEAV